MTLDQVIDKLKYIRKDLTHLEAEIKAKKAERSFLEQMAMDLLDSQGLTKGGKGATTISISEEIVPHVDKDYWQEVWTYLFSHGYTDLLRKQINSAPFRELITLGEEIPHVTPVTIRKLNMRTSNS